MGGRWDSRQRLLMRVVVRRVLPLLRTRSSVVYESMRRASGVGCGVESAALAGLGRAYATSLGVTIRGSWTGTRCFTSYCWRTTTSRTCIRGSRHKRHTGCPTGLPNRSLRRSCGGKDSVPNTPGASRTATCPRRGTSSTSNCESPWGGNLSTTRWTAFTRWRARRWKGTGITTRTGCRRPTHGTS